MFEYSFQSIPVARQRDGLTLEADLREVISNRAAEGWQFVQAINLETHTKPRLELVFAKER